MGRRNSCHPVTVELLGHFRVSPSLCFKASVSAKQVIWKRVFILMKMKLIITKRLLLASFWKLRFLELGSGLLSNELMMSCIILCMGFLSKRTILVIQRWSSWWIIVHFQDLFTNHDNVLLQFTTARLITIYDNVLLQFTIAWVLQFSTTVITIYDR